MTDNPFDSPAFELFAKLHEKSLTETFQLGNEISDGYKRDAERAQAELDLVRYTIVKLLDGPFVPNPDRVRAALWPMDGEVDAYLAKNRKTPA